MLVSGICQKILVSRLDISIFWQIPLTNMVYFYIIPPYIKMLDFHWIKVMLFFRKYYDFLQFFLHHGIFFPAILSAVVFFRNTTAGGKIPCLKIDRD
jgi:hypothetical protein